MGVRSAAPFHAAAAAAAASGGDLLPRVGVDDHFVRRREVVLRQHVRAAVPAGPRVRGGAQLARVMDGVERVDGALERLVVRVERTRRAPEQPVQARLHLLQPVEHRYQLEVLRDRLCVARHRFCLGDGPSGSEAMSSRRTRVTNRVGAGDAVGEARRAWPEEAQDTVPAQGWRLSGGVSAGGHHPHLRRPGWPRTLSTHNPSIARLVLVACALRHPRGGVTVPSVRRVELGP
eukprot:CAMPEP_0179860756 /NCGR_PEP_ID=MMETSP0982-20121206/13835_1 /TAXON_ID=483367 /ORGANISM="non described non described, Strain CCMP 2436" /LENGTH=232 /DNA_ID=CAMNT_0021748127 /DNA_START=586 /DNA_END=1282 /DNA_ORIENTATION=+